jgi:hypothetical protein
MMEHQKRTHGIKVSSASSRNMLEYSRESFSGHEESQGSEYENGQGEEDLSSGTFGNQVMDVAREDGEGDMRTPRDLGSELERLRLMRAEIDADIKSLERAVLIIGGGSL